MTSLLESFRLFPPIKATEVFVPNDFPKYTYVERSGINLEQQLKDAIATPNMVVSVSGPSKTGKTQLIQRVVPRVLKISGARIRAASDLWRLVCVSKELAGEASERSSHGTIDSRGSTFTGSISLGGPSVSSGSSRLSQSTTGSERYRRAELDYFSSAISSMAGTDEVVFIDDFHYIPPEVQVQMARQIKDAAEQNLKIIVASVPHRSDDVVRSNHELRGRVVHIDTKAWRVEELTQIADLGFAKLNIELTSEIKLKFANEACTSPQIMQSICLGACRELGIFEELESNTAREISEDQQLTILEQCASGTFKSLLDSMHLGALKRGRERKQYEFTDGSSGDVYRAVLLAMRSSRPRLSFPYQELQSRVDAVCSGSQGIPDAASIRRTCGQLADIADNERGDISPIAYDNGVLTIVDPYFLFYLRSSSRLAELASDE